ncbi:MAG: AI-2E family transporter, partial [Lachnospiraceae bacterium]|nr:AI-2E family transporter [Lachnospiraceae bacterium]
MNDIKIKRFVQCGIIVALLCLVVIHFQTIIGWAGNLLLIAYPLLLGCIMAYVLNILMVRLERIYFPHSKNSWINQSRRGICITFSLALLVLIVIFVMYLVVPQVVDCFVIISKDVPDVLQRVIQFLIDKSDELPTLQHQLQDINLDWGNIINKVSTGLLTGTKGVLTSATTIVGSVVGAVTNVVIGLIFSLYVLACKEDIQGKTARVGKAFMRSKTYERCTYVLGILHESFSNFIVGQVTEAVILGGLCAIGMSVLRLPYAAPIGALVGLTALIPVFGAYIGAVLGAFMIVTVAPRQTLVFLIFLLVLQQIEGNLIYPKVVGSSIGLPGIWVLAAIILGSGLGGVAGMLVGVPVAATVYKLLRNATVKREAEGKSLPDSN